MRGASRVSCTSTGRNFGANKSLNVLGMAKTFKMPSGPRFKMPVGFTTRIIRCGATAGSVSKLILLELDGDHRYSYE